MPAVTTSPRWVLLPGLDGTGDLFDSFVKVCGPDAPIEVVRYTTPEVSRYIECTAVVRRALPVGQPYILVGESFSGPIAISIAAESPPDLLGLVLVAAVRERLREIAQVDVRHRRASSDASVCAGEMRGRDVGFRPSRDALTR